MLAGDVNANGTVDETDLDMFSAMILGENVELTLEGRLAADVNGDGEITATDIARANAIFLDKTAGW